MRHVTINFIPDGLGVRIPDSHSGGPGSIPGQGELFSSNFESTCSGRYSGSRSLGRSGCIESCPSNGGWQQFKVEIAQL